MIRSEGLADRFWRNALPGLIITLFILASLVPTPVPGSLVPDMVLMLVFLAAAFRQDAFPVWLCFLLGLLADLLGGTPPGLQAAVFVGTHAFAHSQRVHLRLVQFLWSGFGLVMILATVFRWSLLSGYYGVWLEPGPLTTNLAISVFVFPIVAYPLQWLIGGTPDAARRA